MSINSMQVLTQMMGGMDTSTIISQLDYINRQSIYQPGGLNDNLTQIQQQQTDWQNVNNSALTLQNLLDSLNSNTTFGSFTATPTDSTILTASAGTSASPGTYTINVTGIGSDATLQSGGRLGVALASDGSDPITTTKLSTAITTGTFAINVNGQEIPVPVSTGNTIKNVLDGITSAITSAGFTAPTWKINGDGSIEFDTTNGETISFGSAGDTSNFLSATGLNVASGVFKTQALGGSTPLVNTDPISTSKLSTSISTGSFVATVNGKQLSVAVNSSDTIQDVLDRVNSQITGAGLAALSWTVNGDGSLQFDSKGQTVSFADGTSNFASDTGLDIASGVYKTSALGQVQLGQYLQNSNANFATGVTATTSGSFTINNVSFTYDTSKDTLSTILNRINTSTAGVTAAYDPINDKVTLTSKTSQAVTVADGTGCNLMSALKLTTGSGGVSTAGSPWSLSVNGSPVTSVSGTVTNAIPGVSINLLQTGQTTLTIASDTSQSVQQIQDFVTQFNSLYGMIGNLTAKGADLQFDPTMTDYQSSLMNAVTSPVKTIGWDSNNNTIPLPNYPQQALMGIGISTGAVGSKVGTTNSLKVDTSKLTAALQQNPAMVRDLIKGMSIQLNQVLTNMTGMVNSLSDPTIDVLKITGMSTSQDSMYQNMIKDINNQIQTVNDAADQQKQLLVQEFTAMNAAINQSHTQMSAMLGFSSGSSAL